MGVLSAKIGHFLCIKRLISMGCLGPTQCSMSRPGGPPHPGEVQERVPLGCGIGRVANFKLRNVGLGMVDTATHLPVPACGLN